MCAIKSKPKLVLSDNSRIRDLKELFSFVDCNPKQTDKFLRYIADYRGELSPRQLSLQLRNKNIITLNDLSILSMDEFLQQEMKIKSPLSIKKSNIIGEKVKSFSLEEFDDVQVLCKRCNEMGSHTYKLSIQNINGKTKNLWINSETVTQAKVLIPTNSIIVNNNPLNAKLFTWQTLYTSSPNQYFTDLKQLPFYKLTRNIKKNTPLKRNALTYVTLVKAGQLASITMSHKGLRLESKGKAIRNGNIGDTVSLQNMKTKKIIIGKVIGENLVEVKL